MFQKSSLQQRSHSFGRFFVRYRIDIHTCKTNGGLLELLRPSCVMRIRLHISHESKGRNSRNIHQPRIFLDHGRNGIRGSNQPSATVRSYGLFAAASNQSNKIPVQLHFRLSAKYRPPFCFSWPPSNNSPVSIGVSNSEATDHLKHLGHSSQVFIPQSPAGGPPTARLGQPVGHVTPSQPEPAVAVGPAFARPARAEPGRLELGSNRH